MEIDAILTRADAFAILEGALARPEGIVIRCPSHAVAVNTRHRLNYWRSRDREAAAQIYPPDHPNHGRSAYDVLVLRVPKPSEADANTLFIERRPKITIEIEGLPRAPAPTGLTDIDLETDED